MPKQKGYNTRAIYFTDKLRRQMAQILNFPCTLVEAPMGYGKTTAVREYLNSTDARVLWHRVYDSSVSGFWITFSRLLRELDLGRSADLEQLGFPNDSVSMQEALKMIEEIELPTETVLVIDDYHLLSATDVSSFIWFLVVNEIDHLHIVLTTRFVERLRIEELSLKGFLYHIEKEIFELMPNEITEYYKLCGINLRAAEADQLYAITEGWISALYLLMLGTKELGSFVNTNNIHKLVKDAIYDPFSEEIKDFLLCLCIFDSFTMRQAIHMWGDKRADLLLAEVRGKNAFVNYDADAKTYQIHSIFTSFLRELLEKKDSDYKRKLYEKAGQWCIGAGGYIAAMHYAYLAGDYDKLLKAVELDSGYSINSEYKDLFVKYFNECPNESKKNFPLAMLVYARRLFTFNEIGLFKKACSEFMTNMQNMDGVDDDYKGRLLGEYELLLSFTGYNDIEKMSEYHRRACKLLKEPSTILDTKATWTFGSPSVLYMFHRRAGELEKEVQTIREAMPFYYQVTNSHGKGAELVMEAERYLYTGDIQNSEIAVYKALQTANETLQSGIIICAVFLQIRLNFMKGDFADILVLFSKIRKDINKKKDYLFMHTLDMCEAYIYSCLNLKENIPSWITRGEFKNTRLLFPSMAFLNIVYGRVLLLNGEYLKLIGSSDNFIKTASVFPNLLGQIHTYIYVAAANKQIFRQKEALAALKQSLDIAMPDKVYMPFVENCDFIKPLLEELYNEGTYREDIAKILEQYSSYKKAVEHINRTYFAEDKPQLSQREEEIARLASEGLSNRQIGEKLFISENTVKKHLKGVFEKLGVGSRSLLMQHFDSTG